MQYSQPRVDSLSTDDINRIEKEAITFVRPNDAVFYLYLKTNFRLSSCKAWCVYLRKKYIYSALGMSEIPCHWR